MFRRTVVDKLGMYPYNYRAAEDYAFFYNIYNQISCFFLNNLIFGKSIFS